jgi:membrane glycosyltransferase
MLFAPILMVTQTVAVLQILSGSDSGWNPQRRSADGIGLWDAIVFCRWHVVIGVAATALCYVAATSLLGWMAPILLGLIFAPVLAWATSKRAAGIWRAVLATPERRRPPVILSTTLDRIADWSGRVAEGRLTDSGDLPKAA